METKVIESRFLGTRPTLVAEATLTVPEIGPWLGKVYGGLAAHLAQLGESPVGPPFARYHRLEGGRFRVEAGFPVAAHLPTSDGTRGASLPGGRVAVITHIGPYDGMEASYQTLAAWIESRGAVPEGDAWEIYYSEPTDPPETWRTDIVQPYRAAERLAGPSIED